MFEEQTWVLSRIKLYGKHSTLDDVDEQA